MGVHGFVMRMRTDRAFRGRLLAAGKDGFEAALHEEGYEFTTDELKESLPQIHTGVRAGVAFSCLAAYPVRDAFHCWAGPFRHRFCY